jgi:anti-sigma factor RsiW
MNCTQFRKYAGAFADGELDVQLNLESLEHLNMCPDCTRRVDEVSTLRAALERTYADHRAPDRLRTQIKQSLVAEPCIAATENDSSGTSSRSLEPRRRRSSRWLVPLSLAAAVLFAVSAWQNWPRVGSGTMTIMAARTVADAAKVHTECVNGRWHSHHNPEFPRDLEALAQHFGDTLGFRAIVPDYAGSGFAFLGGDLCSISGRQAGHALYGHPQKGHALSVFSTNRIPELRPDGLSALGDTDIFVRRVGEVTVAALTEGEQTYTFCSDLAEVSLLRMVRQVRTAGVLRNPQPLTSLAFTGGGMAP